MSSRIKSIWALGFSFLLVFSAIPSSWLHHHEEEHEHHCHLDHDVHEADLCHIALYHPDESVGQCNHESHYSEKELPCEWCQLDLQLHTLYDLNVAQDGFSLESGEVDFNYLEQHHFRAPNYQHIRGPPQG